MPAPLNPVTMVPGRWVKTGTLVPLVSATGSVRMGRKVATVVAERLGRSLLELGGNNAGIVCPSADLDMALRAVAFGAMGTAGQRCTTMRRLFVHDSVYDALLPRLKAAYASVSIGNPLETQALVGPLIDRAAVAGYERALAQIDPDALSPREALDLLYQLCIEVNPCLDIHTVRLTDEPASTSSPRSR